MVKERICKTVRRQFFFEIFSGPRLRVGERNLAARLSW